MPKLRLNEAKALHWRLDNAKMNVQYFDKRNSIPIHGIA